MSRHRDLYDRLSTRSKRALLKQRKRFGHPYQYSPRTDLLIRLAEETNSTPERVRDDLFALRERIMRHGY